jgi:peptide/nickel transport system ATP-binding protein
MRNSSHEHNDELAVVQAVGFGINIAEGKAGPRTLFANLNFELFPAQTLAITGASGSGKTTLAKVIAGLQGNFEGELSVAAVDLRRSKFSKSQRQALAMVFQDSGLSLNPKLNVGEIIAEPLLAQGKRLTKLAKQDLVNHFLAEVGLSQTLAERYPASLSVGQRQRVSIARALTLSPSLIIADEPTSSLDEESAVMIMNLFSSMQKKLKFALVLITHDIGLARKYADQVLELDSQNAAH